MLQICFSSLRLIRIKAVPKFCMSAKVNKELTQVPWETKSKSLLSVQLNINFGI